jgi:uncharacterized protein YndB with AHSA1/START domain
MTSADRTPRSFTLTWLLDSPPETVFGAWTDPDRLGWFYNPEQPIPEEPIELDLRVGGAWRQMMLIDEDTSYFTGGVYREIVPNERLVFAWGATGGWPQLDLEDLDQSPQVTLRLKQTGSGTKMTLHVELPADLPDDGVPNWWPMFRGGMKDTVDRLAAELSQTRTRA